MSGTPTPKPTPSGTGAPADGTSEARPPDWDQLLAEQGAAAQDEAAANLLGFDSGQASALVLVSGKSKGGQRITPSTMKLGEVAKQIYGLKKDELIDLQRKLKDGGYYQGKTFTEGAVDDATMQAWDRLLLRAAREYASNPGQAPTVTGLLSLSVAAGEGKQYEDDAADGGARYHKDTSTSVTLTDALSAQSLLKSTMQTLIGRSPTPDEIMMFTGELNSAESGSPTSRTVTQDSGDSTTGLGGSTDNPLSTSSNSITTGGMDSSQFAENWVRSRYGGEAGSFAKGVTYYDVLLQSLGIMGR